MPDLLTAEEAHELANTIDRQARECPHVFIGFADWMAVRLEDGTLEP